MRTWFSLLCLVLSQPLIWSQSDTLVVAHLVDYRPYSWFNADSNQSQGMLIDWWKIYGNKQAVHVEFVPCNAGECTELITSGQADAIAGVFADREGMDSLLFVDEILRVKTALYIRKNKFPKSLYDITDSLAILASSPSIKVLRRNFETIPLKVYTKQEAFDNALENKDVYGYFFDIPAPLIRINPYPVASGYAKFHSVHNDALRPAISKDSTALLNEIQLVASSYRVDELLTLARKYDMEPTEEPKPWPLFVGLISLFVVILGGMILRFNRTLQRVANGSSKRTLYDWKKLINDGESDSVEFKSSMRYDHRELKANKALEYVIIKTMSAFLNTSGGVLFIGVNDTGEIIGIEHDYSVLSKPNADGFLLVLTNLINKYFGKDSHRSIQAQIVSIEDKDICIIELLQHSEPLFLKKGEKEEFYVRAAAASVPLGLKETATYIREHWPN